MVLVDTAVWIAFLRGQPTIVAALTELLEAERVLGHPFVAGELLLGSSGTDAVLEEYAQLRQGPIVAHGEVVAFVAAHGFARQGLGWVDVHLLAAAILTRAQVWTLDRALVAAAARLGVAHPF
jgi:predicted nucleic acid-binding protein